MWKDYSINYIKKNKSTVIFISIIILVASMFISLLCTLFYNMWIDEIERIKITEGDWQVRIIKDLSEEEIQTLQNFENVERVEISDNTYVYFEKISKVYETTELIERKLNISEKEIEYHSNLLQKQFVYSKENNEEPTPVEIFYIAVIFMLCFTLILVVKNAFSFFVNANIKELSTLQSIGATPKQLRRVILQEAGILSILPIIIGNILGIGAVKLFIQYANSITSEIDRQVASFHYNIAIFLITFIIILITIFISIWISTRKLKKLELIELVRGKKFKIAKIKKYRIFSKIFGIEGELVRKSIYIRRKEFRTSTICLTISFLTLSIFLNFMTMSEISTDKSYWNRFQNIWDIMVEINGNKIDDEDLDRIRNIKGISNIKVYSLDSYKTLLSKDKLNSELISKDIYNELNRIDNKEEYNIDVPIVILDNISFENYCKENNIINKNNEIPTGIIVNKIGDVLYRGNDDSKYVPFIKEENNLTLDLIKNDEAQEKMKIEIIGYSQNIPEIREDFDRNSLLIIMSEEVYRNTNNIINTSYLNVKVNQNEDIYKIANEIDNSLDSKYNYTIENRIDSYNSNKQIYEGYKKIITLICIIIACIGISNVFANVFGYMQERKYEFAEYLSVGITPKGIAKILLLEGTIIGIRPILISIPFNILFILLTTSSGNITLNEFISQMPILTVVLFAIIMISIIALIYYIICIKILKLNIAEILKRSSV